MVPGFLVACSVEKIVFELFICMCGPTSLRLMLEHGLNKGIPL